MIWILVGHRADARLFKTSGRHGDMQLIREFDYPEGRRQNREIDSDAKGSRYSATAGRGRLSQAASPSGQMKHGFDPQMEAAEHITDIFAKELATVLRDGRTKNEYDEVILVAEPGFLGKIRKFLDKDTSRRVSAVLNRNLTGLGQAQLVQQLDEFVHQTRKVA